MNCRSIEGIELNTTFFYEITEDKEFIPSTDDTSYTNNILVNRVIQMIGKFFKKNKQ